MAILMTTDTAIAMYDSVSERPIEGLRVFASLDHAEDFLRWMTEQAEQGKAPHRDPRALNWLERDELHERWVEERVDPETGLLR